MKIDGQSYHTIWLDKENDGVINIIDQRFLPHIFKVAQLRTVEDAASAIKEMWVRGAPLIGVTAAFGMYLAAIEAQHHKNAIEYLEQCARQLLETRPTAVNLQWAVNQQLCKILKIDDPAKRIKTALNIAQTIKKEDIEACRRIGVHGTKLIDKISKQKEGKTVNILTHCNAGWLACVDWGTATSPIYQAYDKGIDVHVWVDETRPRNQGTRLTAWELGKYGIPHTIITDNAGGHLMQHGLVDICIVGTDRTTASGDVANKIGTYLKALAAKDNDIPFYVALPSSTIDWNIKNGVKNIPIEVRNEEEVLYISGWHNETIKKVRLAPEDSTARNYSFDVTPARLISGLITEKGICEAKENSIKKFLAAKESQV